MRVLFCVSHPGFVRNLGPVFTALSNHGHDVHVLFDQSRSGNASLLASLDAMPRVSWSVAPDRRRAALPAISRRLRLSLDYLRFLDNEFASSPRIRERARARVPRGLRAPGLGKRAIRDLYRRLLSQVERVVGSGIDLDEILRRHAPDVVVLSPFFELGSPQTDYVRSAKALGIASVACVTSWDSLTIKGLVHERPDQLLVWNEVQRFDAVVLHKVPEQNVVVVGAFPYDHWFGWSQSQSRREFCSTIGLDSAEQYVLYVCSSPFVAPHELDFVRRWSRELRQRDGWLASVGILVRPHPQQGLMWKDGEATALENLAVWPPTGADPIDQESRDGYYLSLRYSAAVVGVNTSAMLEAAIIGRPVLTVLAEEFTSTQEGTRHFRQLVDCAEGLVNVAGSLHEHANQLEQLGGTDVSSDLHRRFIRTAIRPHGHDQEAAPCVVAALEAASVHECEARGRPAHQRVLHTVLTTCIQPIVGMAATIRDRRFESASQEVRTAQ